MVDSNEASESGTFLEQIRGWELERAIEYMPPGSRVLELGAGSGWQARALAARGYDVCAIDVPNSNYRSQRVWPVVDYDGHAIPFEDASFDVIFSSNVLEHIAKVEEIQEELRRVLRSDGLAIHILPSATWRIWTSLSHYLFICKTLLRLVGRRETRDDPSAELSSRLRRRGIVAMIGRTLLSPRHGERGNSFSEVFLFSRFRWRRLFRETGWTQVKFAASHLFYTGYLVLGPSLTIATRSALSRVLGSACIIFVLRKS